MTEQVSLFETLEEAAYRLIEPRLKQIVCTENRLSEDHLKLIKRKLFYSLQFDSSVILRIGGGNNPKISIARKGENGGSFEEFSLGELAQIKDYESRIAAALQYVIDQLPTEYSCCSRYEECSDARSCTNPIDEIAAKCSYRKKLQKGIVFYGKNRNAE